jgi:hypothetical protein
MKLGRVLAAGTLGMAVAVGLIGSPEAAQADWSGPRLMDCANQTMHTGAKGDCVESLQKNLEAYGYEIEVDGRYGSETRLTVTDFQRRHGLAVDGIAGRETMTSLDRWANAPHEDPVPRQVPDPQRGRSNCDWSGACYNVASRSGTAAFAALLNEWDSGAKGIAKDVALKGACMAVINPALITLCEFNVIVLDNMISDIAGRAVKESACLRVTTRPVFIGMHPAVMPDLSVDNGKQCTN